MSAIRTYLDWNATAPLRPQARTAMLAALEEAGNPSSVHAEGRRARAIVERAREQVAELVGAEPRQVIFTSGATEAAHHVLAPQWWMGRQRVRMSRLYVSAIEHPCVLEGGRFEAANVDRLSVERSGAMSLDALARALAAHDHSAGRALVALMAANNETGIMQPVAEAAAIVRDADGLLVCDAVQAAGRWPVDMAKLGAHAVILSSHKIGGPAGVGALVLADTAVAPERLLAGGGQERGLRAGTENFVGIAGFGEAAMRARQDLERMGGVEALRDGLEASVRQLSPGATVVGVDVARLPNTSCIIVPGIAAETLVIALDLDGVAISAGAACSSGKVAASHVLPAMGIPADLARSAVRLSLGWSTTQEDVDRLLAAWSKIMGRLATRKAA